MLKSLSIGAKDLPLPPLPPTVIQASSMASDNGIGNAISTSASASGNCTTVVYAFPEEDHIVVGYLNEWINAYSFITSKYTIGRSLFSAGKTSAGKELFLSILTTLARIGYDRVVYPTRANVDERYLFILVAA